MRLIPRSLRRDRDPSRSMTVIEHLTELRRRLTIALATVVLGAIVGWIFYEPVIDFLTRSYVAACETLDPENQPPQGCDDLATFGVLGPFVIRLKISFFTGLALAMPVVLFQLWRFVTPGLTKRERRLTIPFVLSSMVLFALGGFFAFLTMSRGLKFLLGFAGERLVPIITIESYISFIITLTVAFGLSFEFPLILIFLSWVRVVSTRRLRDWRRYAYLVIAISSAAITPSQDPYTMLAMMIPMLIFYEVAILVARLMKR